MISKKRKFRRLLLTLKTAAGLKLIVIFMIVLLISSLIVFNIERKHNPGYVSFFDSVWWTVVTVSTVGYGDRYPVTTGGRVTAMLVIFLGVAMMGTVTGRIASVLMERQMKEEKGLLNYEGLKNHFIICGWKREMINVLNEMLGSNLNLDASQIVMVNKASIEEINELKNDPELKGIKYVHGDFIEERDLVRAGIKNAGRVLVVADYYTEGSLQQIDSKTVMAVMTIKNLNKKAFVCAEILDTKYEKYLRLSHCDEVLLSREFSRTILASASQGLGTSHVVQALFSKKSNTQMTTKNIPESFVGKTFGEMRDHFRNESNYILIGLLENTGNLITRKSEALRETQKNPDISRIITDLRTIKTLTANEPVINPPTDYRIKKFSKGIIIAGSTMIGAPVA